ncbi:unnamed protein product [Ectocarpus sp. 4 AP-2014]
MIQRVARAAATRGWAAAATRSVGASSSSSSGSRRAFSDNVTYSGGQAGVQGGFYGAGGARSQASPQAHHRPEAIAAVDDIRRLREAMQLVSEMEIELGRLGDKVSGRSIELKSAIKKRLSSPTMLELLTRLEIKDQPVWGLTQEERELVKVAREKVNSC